MAKNHRGKGIREQFARGRGECPVCKRTCVKILYEQSSGEQKFKICKICKAAIKNGTKSLPGTVKKEEPAAAVVEAAQSAAVAAAPVEAVPVEAAAESPAAEETASE